MFDPRRVFRDGQELRPEELPPVRSPKTSIGATER